MQDVGLRLSLLLYVILSRVCAFGTINEPNVIGQHCEHERITRAAFACDPSVRVSDGRCFEENTLHQLAGTSQEDGYVGQGSNGAVGAPDMLDPVPEGPEAHCDNADFLDAEGLELNETYPRTREEASAQLQTCTTHLRMRFAEGLDAADQIVDSHARIIGPKVDISSRDCVFSFPALQMHQFSRSKCSAIEGFGRALHGVQDFYAHSNWADEAKPPYGPENPPGLKRDDYPVFLDLRAENNISGQVPRDLSTGCFGGILTDGPVGKAGHPLEPGSLDCTGRITHHTLNKDNGVIDEVTGKTSQAGPNTPRSNIEGNFERAVFAAIRDSQRQWRHFREEIRRTYGTERGNIMVCALVRDIPVTDCYGRRVAILRDAGNRVAEMQIPIQQWLLEEISGRAHDEGPGEGLTRENSTKSLGSSEDLQLPIQNNDPDTQHQLNPSTISQGPDFNTALESLLLKPPAGSLLPTNKSSIVTLTRARDLHNHPTHLARIWLAGDEGIRVHVGLLPPSPSDVDGRAPSLVSRVKQKVFGTVTRAKHDDFITAVLRTGGTYSVLHNSDSPGAISSFLDHVVSRGLTQYDNARDTATLLLPGLSISDYVTPQSEPRRYSFDAHAFESVVVAVAPITPRLGLHVCVRHVRRNLVIKELDIGLKGNATFGLELSGHDIPRTDAWFELEVAHVKEGGLVGSGLFEVSLETEKGRRGWSGSGEGKERDEDEAINRVERGVGKHHDHVEL